MDGVAGWLPGPSSRGGSPSELPLWRPGQPDPGRRESTGSVRLDRAELPVVAGVAAQVHPLQVAWSDVGVGLGAIDFYMPKQFLDFAHRGTRSEQMGRAGVADLMQSEGKAQFLSDQVDQAQALDQHILVKSASGWPQPEGVQREGGEQLGTRLFQVALEAMQGPTSQRHGALAGILGLANPHQAQCGNPGPSGPTGSIRFGACPWRKRFPAWRGLAVLPARPWVAVPEPSRPADDSAAPSDDRGWESDTETSPDAGEQQLFARIQKPQPGPERIDVGSAQYGLAAGSEWSASRRHHAACGWRRCGEIDETQASS